MKYLVYLLLVLPIGCGDSGEEWEIVPSPPYPDTTGCKVFISYEGSLVAPLRVELHLRDEYGFYIDWPNWAYRKTVAAVFPQTVEFTPVDPSYYVARVFLDVDNSGTWTDGDARDTSSQFLVHPAGTGYWPGAWVELVE